MEKYLNKMVEVVSNDGLGIRVPKGTIAKVVGYTNNKRVIIEMHNNIGWNLDVEESFRDAFYLIDNYVLPEFHTLAFANLNQVLFIKEV